MEEKAKVEKKRLFDPGQMVVAFNGRAGVVMSRDMHDKARKILREGGRPGRYSAPGCCRRPDYVTQVPVLFEDGAYDVMRPMNIKKKPDMSEEKKLAIEEIIQQNNLAA